MSFVITVIVVVEIMIEQLNLLIEILAIDLVVEVCANQVPSQLIVPVQKREQFE